MNLYEYLLKHRLSVTEFSEKIKCSRAHLSKIIHGQLMPSKKLAQTIEEITKGEVKASNLLHGNSQKSDFQSDKQDLWEYLKRQNISITEFGEMLNYSRAHLSKVVHGKQKPSKKLAKSIEEATHGVIKASQLLE